MNNEVSQVCPPAVSSSCVSFKMSLSYLRSGFRLQNHLFRPTTLRFLTTATSDNHKQLKSVDDIPGPTSIPVFGAGWRLIADVLLSRKPLGKLLLDAQAEDIKKYGPISKIDIPGIKIIQLADPDEVAKVLRNEPKYPRRIDFPVLNYYREIRDTIPGVFFANGSDWYKLRKAVGKRILKPREVAEYVSAFNEIITDFIERLHKLRITPGDEMEYEVKDIDNELFKWSFESVAHVLFDRRFGCQNDDVNPDAQDFITSVGGFLSNIVQVGFLPVSFYKIYETKTFKEFVYHFDTMNKYADLFISKKVQQLEREGRLQRSSADNESQEVERVGFVEFILSNDNMTKDDVMASIIDLLFAGVDTTSNTMQWILYMMAKNPDKQDKLHQEIMSVLKQNELPTSGILGNMPYLKACIKETLRLYPVLANQNREIPSDMEILGYHIPKGSHISFMSYYISRDEKNFKQANQFIPERWLRDENHQMSESLHAFSSIPFGFGTRMCVGRRIAELEFQLLTTRLLQKYEITYPDGEEVEPFIRGVTIPDRPLRVKFIERSHPS